MTGPASRRLARLEGVSRVAGELLTRIAHFAVDPMLRTFLPVVVIALLAGACGSDSPISIALDTGSEDAAAGDTNADVEGDTNADVEGDTNADVEGDPNADVEGDTNADVEGDANADVDVEDTTADDTGVDDTTADVGPDGDEADTADTTDDASDDTTADVPDDGDVADTEDTTPSPCVDLMPLHGWSAEPATIAMLVSAQGCYSRAPRPGLDASSFIVLEQDDLLGESATIQLLPAESVRAYVTLLLDMSDSTADVLTELQAGADAMIDQLLVARALENVYVSIEVFDGGIGTEVWQSPTRDTAELHARIAALDTYAGTDAAETNLHGALTGAVTNQRRYRNALVERSSGGTTSSGFLVVFTDGVDTAGHVSFGNAAGLVYNARWFDQDNEFHAVNTLAVTLRGDDYDSASMNDLLGSETEPGRLVEADLADLTAAFVTMGDHVADWVASTYLVAYCSPARSGDIEVLMGAVDSPGEPVSYTFEADAFTDGCDAAFFADVCVERSCGGFNCGACEGTEVCDGADSGQCVDECEALGLCGGEVMTNALGFALECTAPVGIASCGGVCTDVSSDPNNCGGCSVFCISGATCVDGGCQDG